MEQHTPLGRNRTGVQMSPIDARSMERASDQLPADAFAAEAGLASLRRPYIEDSEGLGSVPVPGTLKGTMASAADMIKGTHPQVLVDKLGERLAFERGGTRLYDALLIKCQAAPDALPAGALEVLRRFRDEEAQHFALVVEAIKGIGADPTAQTPCADLVGVESMGLMQAMNDPRTTLPQCLHVVLDAELLDNAGWEMLIGLARAMGHDDMAERFQLALDQETEHLVQVRSWVEQLTLQDAAHRHEAADATRH
jgi:hypothetical protein